MYDQPGRRILIADNDDLTLAWLRRVFEDDCHIVDGTDSGTNAVQLAETNTYDLLVLDATLPGDSGLAVTRAIRAAGDNIPIIILTALASDEDVIEGLNAGADDYLTKPTSVNVLRARVRAVMRRMHAVRADQVCLGDLTLSRNASRASGPLGELELNAREFTLLERLVAGSPMVLSREKLLHDVWGYDTDPGTSELEVALSRVRVRLQAVTANIQLRTLRGVGVVAELIPPGLPRALSLSTEQSAA